MERKVLAGTHKNNVGAESNTGSKTGLTWRKHNQVMNAAQELLYKADITQTAMYESLNCGKLARLLACCAGMDQLLFRTCMGVKVES